MVVPILWMRKLRFRKDVIHHTQAAVTWWSQESNLILSSDSTLFPLCNITLLCF